MSSSITITTEGSSEIIISEKGASEPVLVHTEDKHVVLGGVGPQGPAGSSSGSVFTFTQAVPSDTWVIPHNFGREPVLSVYVSGMGKPVAPRVDNLTGDVVQVCFKSPQSGRAILV